MDVDETSNPMEDSQNVSEPMDEISEPSVADEKEKSEPSVAAEPIIATSPQIADSQNVSEPMDEKLEPDVATENQKSKPKAAEEETVVRNDESVTKNDAEGPTASTEDYSKHITYDKDGKAIYLDPETKAEYKWCTESNSWVSNNIPENEFYRWDAEKNQWILKEQPVKETEYYRWCDNTNQWIPKMKAGDDDENATYGFDDKEKPSTKTDKDGTVFIWDKEKNAWLPRVDDDFLALYHLNYGFHSNENAKSETSKSAVETLHQSEQPTKSKPEPSTGRKRKDPPTWFEVAPEQNTKVYVSNLPSSIEDEEFVELMSKCGMIAKDSRTKKMKCKLYRDSNGELKGDGLCNYIKVESVDLALNVLDGYDVKGNKIKVERAQFQMKGEYNPTLKPKISKSEKKKQKLMQEKLFAWQPDKPRFERGKWENRVIFKNLCDETDSQLIKNAIEQECASYGTIKRIVIHDKIGIGQVTMETIEAADLVVKFMNGKHFGKKQVQVETWDGKTKYKSTETEEELQERLDKWEEFLVEEEKSKE